MDFPCLILFDDTKEGTQCLAIPSASTNFASRFFASAAACLEELGPEDGVITG